MKRTLSLFFALLLILSCLPLAGCGQSRDVSGIGTVELNDKPVEGGVGTLGGSDDTPQDTPTQAPSEEPTQPPSEEPTQAPQDPGGIATEKYEDDSISMTIPKGWTIQHSSDDNGMFYVKAYDSSNTSFCIMFYGAYEPLFPSEESRQLWSEQANPIYGGAPVVSEPTAEQMLLHWNECAAMVEAYQMPITFPALAGVSIIDAGTYEGAFAEYGATESEAVASCTSSKGASCGTYLCTAMLLTDPQAIEAKDTRYYSAFQTYFIMTPQDSWEACYDTLNACLGSLTSKSAAGSGIMSPESNIQGFR